MAIVDPPFVDKFIGMPPGWVFVEAQPGNALVLHGTATPGVTSAEQIAQSFANDSTRKASSHFVIGQDGEIVQCVHLVDGAGANGAVETGYDTYWTPLVQQFGNLNLCTISIEHVNPTVDNSAPLTPKQQASSFKLIKWLVAQYGLDVPGDIHGHFSIDPLSRARCPGIHFPWAELWSYLEMPIVDNVLPAALEVWNSTHLELKPNTGIFNSWLAAYRASKFYGPPIGQELQQHDWNGSPIIRQFFLYAWCEWVNGVGLWYNEKGRIG